MKHTFAKKALLFGALAILTNTISPIAPAPMSGETMPTTNAAVQAEVNKQARFFANFSTEVLQQKLDEKTKKLKHTWGNFMDCATKRKCTKKQVAAVTGALTAILAIITVIAAKRSGGNLGEKAHNFLRSATAKENKFYENASNKASELKHKAYGKMRGTFSGGEPMTFEKYKGFPLEPQPKK